MTMVNQALAMYNAPKYPFNSVADIAAVNSGRGRRKLRKGRGHKKTRKGRGRKCKR